MWLTWLATVFSLITSACAIPRLVLPLARSRRISNSRWVSPSREAVDWLDHHVRSSGSRRERLDRSACRARLHRRCVEVPEGRTCIANEQPSAGCVVTHAERLELVERSAQLDKRSLRVTLGSQHCAAGTSRVRSQEWCAECGRHLTELIDSDVGVRPCRP